MSIRNLLRLTFFCVLSTLLVTPVARVAAQDAAAGLDTTTRAQMAAVPLTADELPDGYLLQGESFLTAEQVVPEGASGLTAQTLADNGFVAMYVSVYAHESNGGRITSYVSLWDSPESAAVGFGLLEDEAVAAPGGDFTDSELAAGDGPAELTTGTFDADGTPTQRADATFVVGSYIVGVGSEGSAEAVVDNEGMVSLANTLEARATTVVSGNAPAGVDFSLVSSTLDISALGTEIQAGFLSPGEAEQLYGLSGSSLGNLQSSWVSLVAAGDNASAPYIVVGRSDFADAETAARVVEQAADLVPLSISLEPVQDFSVEGANAVRGFQYTSPATPDAQGPNSFRAVAQVENSVIIIDVQDAASVDEARTAVTELLVAQLNCSAEACEAPALTIGA